MKTRKTIAMLLAAGMFLAIGAASVQAAPTWLVDTDYVWHSADPGSPPDGVTKFWNFWKGKPVNDVGKTLNLLDTTGANPLTGKITASTGGIEGTYPGDNIALALTMFGQAIPLPVYGAQTNGERTAWDNKDTTTRSFSVEISGLTAGTDYELSVLARTRLNDAIWQYTITDSSNTNLYSMTPGVWDATQDVDGVAGGRVYAVEASDAVTAPADGLLYMNVALPRRQDLSQGLAGFAIHEVEADSSDDGIIPEPATMALLGLAFAGLGGYVRRRRRA